MMPNTTWPYPGAHWWKFDFHTHTPASECWNRTITPEECTPEKWLLHYMRIGIDCVAITDHNSGEWINRLKDAYAQMKAQADQGAPCEGFRPLTIFPGVEISVNGGIHILAIFDPSKATSDIDTLLGAVNYNGTKGGSDGVTTGGAADVIATIIKAGGIPIPAHVDKEKGLLKCAEGNRCQYDANTVRQALGVEGLLAVEWSNQDNPWPEAVRDRAHLARVLGSDDHGGSLQHPYTWVKMALPTLEGLRLALLDGNGVSIRRSNDGPFDPCRVPAHMITAVEINGARVMGNSQTTQMAYSPFFNAVIGGRGTGKSTIVHTLRLATRQHDGLKDLGEAHKRFEDFREGALTSKTKICVEWQHEGNRFRLHWNKDGSGVAVEEQCENYWRPTTSQAINAARFPIRIFSQGQIAAMASGGRQALLGIIDEAANILPIQRSLEEAERTFFVQRARLRELDGQLSEWPEVERKYQEVERKIAIFGQVNYAAVLQSSTKFQYQQREVNTLLSQLQEVQQQIVAIAEQSTLDDWSTQYFTQDDTDILAWRSSAEQMLLNTCEHLLQEAKALQGTITALARDEQLSSWRKRIKNAQEAHDALQAQFAAQGINDLQAFTQLTQEKQRLEAQRKALQQVQADREVLAQHIAAQQALILERRQAITQARRTFIAETLSGNEHVQMEVAPFGFDHHRMEQGLRKLIGALDNRFSSDILAFDKEKPQGIAFELARAHDKLAALEAVKNALLSAEQTNQKWKISGWLRNYLDGQHSKPEFADRILAWFPEDDLRIEYKRDRGNKSSKAWESIDHGSQGQRSAALLAFLLAFGEEPIILDQPEDDLDNYLIYDLIVQQIRENKLRRQLIVVTHNPNIAVNGDAELVHVMFFHRGECRVQCCGALQDADIRKNVCRVMEGGREAFARRWKRLR